MQTEIEILRAEVAALRGEVRRKRRYGRLLPVALVALFVALIPGLAIAANPFNDLVPNSVHNANIDAIYNAGITTGCVPNVSYCPTDLVTRQEMASFLARTAGLGANAPVANAKTAQSAVTAQTATSAANAANATNATNAANAATVGNFAPNSLLRTSVGGQGNNPIAVGTSYSAAATVTITAPGPGFVYITGAVTVYTTSTGSAFVTAVLADPVLQIASFDQSAVVGTASGSAFSSSISPTTVFPVSGAGTKTYQLLVGKDPASSSTAAANAATISALFVPFGPTGAIAADTSSSVQPLGTPGTRP